MTEPNDRAMKKGFILQPGRNILDHGFGTTNVVVLVWDLDFKTVLAAVEVLNADSVAVTPGYFDTATSGWRDLPATWAMVYG